MPSLPSASQAKSPGEAAPLSFPPVPRSHILNCSYDAWYPRYRSSCIKSRIINLAPDFVEYLREDGIILADEDNGGFRTSQPGDEASTDETEDDWQPQSATAEAMKDAEDEEVEEDEEDSDAEDDTPPKVPPDQRFPALHQQIKDTIKELGGASAPKLNWSSPQDAAWILPNSNTVKCTSPNDVYLLLKSSNFISHDLEHAFDDTVDDCLGSNPDNKLGFQPVLVLRSFFDIKPALEFRCFVKQRNLIAISQRDLRFYEFLPRLKSVIIREAVEIFETKLKLTFPDGNFTFDIYLPESHLGSQGLGRARLIDINPWATRTDSLLFGWTELLDWEVPHPLLGGVSTDLSSYNDVSGTEDEATSTEDYFDEDEEEVEPELRLVEKADAAAFNFSGSRYSAHKLPREVVDASSAGSEGLRDFAAQWNEVMNRNR